MVARMTDVNLNVNCTSLGSARIGALPRASVAGLYVHVPFCVRKCEYCDFYSLSAGIGRSMGQYVDAVLQEAAWWTPFVQESGGQISTVFLGGGTPTMLPPPLMGRLLRGLKERIPIAPEVEWSVEANPATVDGNYCQLLLEHGVNRLSVGAQSFVQGELEILGRAHDADAVRRTIDDAHRAGFGRVSLDLMYGVPGQTLASWRYSLEEAMRLGIKHISCYCLTLEEGTPMWEKTRIGKMPEVPEEQQLLLMRETRQKLAEYGLRAYEISNYAAPGEECRHNMVYWTGRNYIGLGPAAASHLSGRRWRNVPDLVRYLRTVAGGQVAVEDWEELSLSQRSTELAMLMLRLQTGIDQKQFHDVLGLDAMAAFGQAAMRLEKLGMVRRTASGITLTDRGIYVADEVIRELVREGS